MSLKWFIAFKEENNMDMDKILSGLSDEVKEKLKNVKSMEELQSLIDSEGIELSEDAISAVAGGCFRPIG